MTNGLGSPFGRLVHPEPLSIVEDHELYQRVVSSMRERMGVDRPRPGVHLSELIYCLRKGWKMRQLDAMPGGRLNALDETQDEQVFVWVIGHSHEAIFGQGSLRGTSELKDGIWYTPDFFVPPGQSPFLTEADLLTEMKSTRASAKKRMDDGEMAHYLHQVAGYCAAEGRTEGWVWVFHIMGDYFHQTTEGKAKGAGPQAILRCWKVTFDERTLQRWWQELLRRKETILGDVMPDPLPAFEWECGYCKVRELINCPGGAEWQRAQAKRGARPQSLDQADPEAGG